jgi:hypothetical protein
MRTLPPHWWSPFVDDPRHETRSGRFRPGQGQFAPRETTETDRSREQELLELRERIEAGEYEVEARRIAEAIVSRVLTALATGQPAAVPEDC